MITRLLFVIFIFVIAVLLGIFLHKDPGYVIIAIHEWTIETTLITALFSIIGMFFFTHILMSVSKIIYRLPHKYQEWHERKRIKIANDKTRQGLMDFCEGHWQLAEKHLISALPNADLPLINYLTAARAAQELGNSALRDHYLREAQHSMPQATLAVELTQAQLQLAHQQWEQALATLRHLQELAPTHPYVLKLLIQLYQEVQDWPQLITLLPTIKRYKLLDDHALHSLTQRAYLNTLLQYIKHNNTLQIHDFLHKMPKILENDLAISEAYAQYLLDQKDFKSAENFLHHCLQYKREPRWLALYSLLPTPYGSLPTIINFLKNTPQSAHLYLCLGKLCMTEKLWGQAIDYFKSSLQIEPSPSTYAILGNLLEKLKDREGAYEAYREGINML